MKKRILLGLSFLFILFSLNAISAVHTETISIQVEITSEECTKILLDTFDNREGIISINFDENTNTLTVEYDPHRIYEQSIYKWIITTHSTEKLKMFDGTPKPICCSK